MIPEIFAPGIISTEMIEFCMAFSPNGKELFFTRLNQKYVAEIYCMKQTKEGKWSAAEIAPFGSDFGDAEPFFSYDGNKLFFSSRRSLGKEKIPKDDWDLWLVERSKKGWTDPVNLGNPINTKKDEKHPTVSRKGTLFFWSEGDLYSAEPRGRIYGNKKQLSKVINTRDHIEAEPFIAADESFIIFYSAGRPDRIAKGDRIGDLYISYRKICGGWTKPFIMGDLISSIYEENWPRISPDGKYLFFSSNCSTQGRFPDIYWVDAKIIEALKPKNE